MWTGGFLWKGGWVVDRAEKGVMEIKLADRSIPGRKERSERKKEG